MTFVFFREPRQRDSRQLVTHDLQANSIGSVCLPARRNSRSLSKQVDGVKMFGLVPGICLLF